MTGLFDDALIQAELQRQRSINTNLKTTMASIETQNQARGIELEDLRARYTKAIEDSESWNRELQLAINEKQILSNKNDKLQQDIFRFNEIRANEYQIITRSVLKAVEQQFDSLRVDLKISDVGSAVTH